MANTTYFGWETPDDTDLVKDGAAAIRTLGQAIDTSMQDLEGGTTGQILAKNSNTDMDFVWVTNDVGDITAVTAGTGISGGGTSGAVTITNDMATTITASGDIVVGTGSGTYDNLPIGTTGQVLTVDTTVSPYKVKWETPAGGGGKVLQVVSTVKSDSFTATTGAGAYTDVTGLSVTITPSSTTSKILVLASINGQSQVGGNFSAIQLVRASTAIFIGDTAGSRLRASTQLAQVSQDAYAGTPLTFLDSPATTSSTTYKIQGCSTDASGYFYINRTASDTNNASYTRGASSITVLEIGA
jgi:hypothetical protein